MTVLDAGVMDVPTLPEKSARQRVVRRLLVMAVVVLIVGVILLAATSGLGADPMTGT